MKLQCISSMATQALLADLVAAYRAPSGVSVTVESVGGVDAARRVQAGEPFDLVWLAADVIDRLIGSDHLAPGSRVDLARSPMAVAVRADAPRPEIGSEDALRAAVLAAPRIGCSTGPSGTHLMRLFERWDIAAPLQGRIVQAPPGVPVARLLASGEVDLAFQQLSELMAFDGVAVLGTLPPGADFVTTFSAGLGAASAHADAARAMLVFMNSAEAAEIKRRHGMEPAQGAAHDSESAP